MATRQITYFKKYKGDSWGRELGGSAEKVPVIQAGHVFWTALVDVQWKTCVGKVSSKIRLTSIVQCGDQSMVDYLLSFRSKLT